MKRIVRTATEADIPFIFATWLQSYKHDSPITWAIRNDVFFHGHQRVLEWLLIQPGVEVSVSCDENDPEHIFGYLVVERRNPLTAHFAYVKRALRLAGVMSELIQTAQFPKYLEGCEFTHFTNTAEALRKAEKLKGYYNPYLLYGGRNGKVARA